MPAPSDPSAHFTIREIQVTFGGTEFTLPGQPAAWWLSILTDNGDGLRIFPGGLDEPDQTTFDDILLEGQVDVAEVTLTIRDIIEVASGHRWWWTLNLLSVLRGENGTQILGKMTRVDADQVSLAAWVNSLYATLVQWMSREDKVKLDGQLEIPPPDSGISPEEAIDEAAATQAFFGMLNNPGR